jgi:hypothetical protein
MLLYRYLRCYFNPYKVLHRNHLLGEYPSIHREDVSIAYLLSPLHSFIEILSSGSNWVPIGKNLLANQKQYNGSIISTIECSLMLVDTCIRIGRTQIFRIGRTHIMELTILDYNKSRRNMILRIDSTSNRV